jgi:hypothetical protein
MSFLLFVRLVFSKLSEMDIPSWYSFISACIFIIWLFLRAIYRAITSEWLLTSFFFLKYFAYPYILPRIPFVGTTTCLEILLAFAYMIINLLLITLIKVKTITNISTRATIILIINLISFLCGSRLSLITEILRILLRTSIGTHQ